MRRKEERKQEGRKKQARSNKLYYKKIYTLRQIPAMRTEMYMYMYMYVTVCTGCLGGGGEGGHVAGSLWSHVLLKVAQSLHQNVVLEPVEVDH